jgi:hypothetical protein
MMVKKNKRKKLSLLPPFLVLRGCHEFEFSMKISFQAFVFGFDKRCSSPVIFDHAFFIRKNFIFPV